MGLDVVLYLKGGSRLVSEITEPLHKAIFTNEVNLKRFTQVPRLRDYYKTNVMLSQHEATALAKELEEVKSLLKSVHHSELGCHVSSLQNPEIQKVHIGGD